METLWRRLTIVSRLVSFARALIAFARQLSKANKAADNEAKKNLLLEGIGNLAKGIPYDLPELLRLEFKNDTGGK